MIPRGRIGHQVVETRGHSHPAGFRQRPGEPPLRAPGSVGIKLEVHGASPAVLWTIAAAAVAMFFWQLFRDRLGSALAGAPSLPKMPAGASNFLTLPSTQRWIILALVLACLDDWRAGKRYPLELVRYME